MEFYEEQKEIRKKYQKKYGDIIRKENDVCAFKYKGFDCIALRHMGHINGYVGIPKDHPFYGMKYYYYDYDNEGLTLEQKYINSLNAHGGLTYANNLNTVSIEGYDFSYCYGFDTAHGGDAYDAGTHISYTEGHTEYRTQEYVINEIKYLVDQILLFLTLNTCTS